ncbi:MAG: YceI family protein [Thiotrichales bacterium]|nr:YceI family protein [Thiotrichales bacterium]
MTGIALGLSLSAMAYAEPVNYAIDTGGMHASVNFKIQHLGYSWLTGRFEKFSGDYVYDAQKLSNSQIKVTIETASVNSNHAERDKHLRSADFLNVSKYPQATFESTHVTGSDSDMTVNGKFTLNGVTRDVVIKAHKMGEGKDPWGGYRSGFSGTTEIALKDYNVKMDLGPASAKVLLELHLEGIRK